MSYQPNNPYPHYAAAYDRPPMKHSGPGIVSFVLSIICGFGFCGLIVMLGLMVQKNPGIENDTQHPAMIATGLAMVIFGVLLLVGLILGIVGCIQRDRRAVFAILGTVFNGLGLLGTLMIFVMGMAKS